MDDRLETREDGGLWLRFLDFLATGGYTGLSPYAPGTVGTLWGVAIAYLLSIYSTPVWIVVIVAGFLVASYASHYSCILRCEHDASSIVIDEVIGFLIAAFFVPFGFYSAILLFLLFRFFDILKPFPIKAIDRGVGGGIGVVLDDVLAGVFAGIVAKIVLSLWA